MVNFKKITPDLGKNVQCYVDRSHAGHHLYTTVKTIKLEMGSTCYGSLLSQI